MSAFIRAILSIIACLLFLGAVLVALFALMDAISYSAWSLARAIFALPLLLAALALFAKIDRECDKLSSK